MPTKKDTYHIAAITAKEVKRLKNDEAHSERLVRDYFKGQARRPEVSLTLTQFTGYAIITMHLCNIMKYQLKLNGT